MGSNRAPGIFAGVLAVLICPVGRLGAQTYTIAIPGGSAAFYDASVSASVGWEVTFSFDAEHCKLLCAYHRSREVLEIPFEESLLPPVATIHIYTRAAAAPLTVVVDPGGLACPAMCRGAKDLRPALCLPTRKLLLSLRASGVQAVGDLPPMRTVHTAAAPFDPSAAAPLRV